MKEEKQLTKRVPIVSFPRTLSSVTTKELGTETAISPAYKLTTKTTDHLQDKTKSKHE